MVPVGESKERAARLHEGEHNSCERTDNKGECRNDLGEAHGDEPHAHERDICRHQGAERDCHHAGKREASGA